MGDRLGTPRVVGNFFFVFELLFSFLHTLQCSFGILLFVPSIIIIFTTEVKQRRAWLVLRWVTAWEHHVL